MTAVRCLAFGDLGAGIWGAGLVAGEGDAGYVVLGAGEDAAVFPFELDASEDAWRLRGERLELTIACSGEEALARATGSFTLDGSDRAVGAPAWHERLPDPGELDSLRLLAAWYEDEALALAALRPLKARGQEDDQVVAAHVESDRLQEVNDARLSTTYSGEGRPARAGVELWISEPAQEPGTVSERPHRLAGEAIGPELGWSDGALVLSAQRFRWHSHSRDGLGVYVLGRAG